MGFLDQYTKKHFADEERYMLSINYPGYDEQKKAHTAFIGQQKLRSDYQASGGSLTVIIQANKMVIDWLTKHISIWTRRSATSSRESNRSVRSVRSKGRTFF